MLQSNQVLEQSGKGVLALRFLNLATKNDQTVWAM
jgi:hypothetical protein